MRRRGRQGHGFGCALDAMATGAQLFPLDQHHGSGRAATMMTPTARFRLCHHGDDNEAMAPTGHANVPRLWNKGMALALPAGTRGTRLLPCLSQPR